MQTAQLKKTTAFRLTNSRARLLLCKIVAAISLLSNFNYSVIAQSNTVYGIEALKINTGDNNSAFGYAALHANTTGFANTANGVYALFSNTTGYHNTANGVYALRFNTTGYLNTANGFGALYSNTTGNWNTANGVVALYYNTTGNNNVANGFQTLYSNTTGSYNTASGNYALHSNTTGSNNTASGNYALSSNITGIWNTASGSAALLFTTTGSYNTASGMYALSSNTTGSQNAAIGYLADVTKGDLTNATAIGANAKISESNAIQLGDNAVTKIYAGVGNTATLVAGGLQITGGTPAAGKVLTSDANGIATWQNPMGGGTGWGLTGTAGTVDGTNFIGTTDNIPLNIRVNNQKAGRIDANNAFYGYQSGNARTTGGFNTAMGYQSLDSLTTGDSNTAIGDRSLLANTTGNCNTAIGSLALSKNISGRFNTAIGYNADVLVPNLENATAIGNAAIVSDSNKIRLGNAAVTEVETQFKYTTVSDGRFKNKVSEEDIKGLEFIKKLRPVAYNFDTRKFQEHITQNMPTELRKQYMNKDFSASTNIRRSGFIAQEVEKAAEETGYNFDGVSKPQDAKGNYSLAYSQFVVPLVKAVQELDKKNEQLQKEKEQQQQKMDQLQQRMEALEKLIAGNSNFNKEPVT